MHVAEKICRAIQTTSPTGCETPSVTVSIGVATFPACADNVYSLFDAADEALAWAQKNGRNQAVLAHPHAMAYSCNRNSSPSPKISAPLRMVAMAIVFADNPFCRSLPITSAHEIPARKRNNGAGKVPPSCDHMKNVDLRASGLSHES